MQFSDLDKRLFYVFLLFVLGKSKIDDTNDFVMGGVEEIKRIAENDHLFYDQNGIKIRQEDVQLHEKDAHTRSTHNPFWHYTKFQHFKQYLKALLIVCTNTHVELIF